MSFTCSNIRRPGPAGFTLIELLVASLLASMLLVALGGVIGQVARRRADMQNLVPASHHEAMIRQLSWDLLHARKIAADEFTLKLVGYGGRSPATGAALGRPTEVIYEIVTLADTGWLVRSERLLDEQRSRAPAGQLVCKGAAQLRVMDASGRNTIGLQEVGDRLGAIPSAVDVTLDSQEGEAVFHHLFELE